MDTGIWLDDGEQRTATHLARCRMRVNHDGGVRDAQVGPQDGNDIWRDGLGAELAFCKLFNVYPDLSTHIRSGGADCVVAGRSVDVKATRYPGGKLLAVPAKLQKDGAELYALMVCRWPRFDYVGMTTKEKLLRPESLTNLGHGTTYAMDQDDLTRPLTAADIFRGDV